MTVSQETVKKIENIDKKVYGLTIGHLFTIITIVASVVFWYTNKDNGYDARFTKLENMIVTLNLKDSLRSMGVHSQININHSESEQRFQSIERKLSYRKFTGMTEIKKNGILSFNPVYK